MIEASEQLTWARRIIRKAICDHGMRVSEFTNDTITQAAKDYLNDTAAEAVAYRRD